MTIARIDTICIYQVSVKFASHSGHTNLMSKTNCPVKFPCFLDYYGNREKNSLKASLCVCVRGGGASVTQYLEGTLCPRSHDSNLTNYDTSQAS